jgi:hypothetical protein
MKAAAAPPSDGGRADSASRAALVRPVAGSLLTALVILVAYFTLPMKTAMALGGLLLLVVGLGIVAVVLAWQIRTILVTPYPAARAVASFVVVVPLFLTVFATIYWLLALARPLSWSEPLTRLDAMYYAITVFATVGFGDVTAVSQTARAVTSVQMLSGLALVGVIARFVVGAAQLNLRRRHRE